MTYTLAVNPDFNDENINRGGGVDYPREPEVGEGEQAIAQAFNDDIGSLRAWVDWAARATGGGLAGLAAALLGMRTPDYKDKAFKAEQRKLQEYRQGKYKSAAGARRQRIQNLNAKLLREGEVNLKVLGDWTIVSSKGGKPQVRRFHWWTVENQNEENLGILDAGGRGFCGWVEEHYGTFTRMMVSLDHVYALQIERIKPE